MRATSRASEARSASPEEVSPCCLPSFRHGQSGPIVLQETVVIPAHPPWPRNEPFCAQKFRPSPFSLSTYSPSTRDSNEYQTRNNSTSYHKLWYHTPREPPASSVLRPRPLSATAVLSHRPDLAEASPRYLFPSCLLSTVSCRLLLASPKPFPCHTCKPLAYH